MIVFSSPNLASSVVERRDLAAAPANNYPDISSKDEYRRWCANAKTQHSFISQIEGLQLGVRVSIGNPPSQ